MGREDIKMNVTPFLDDNIMPTEKTKKIRRYLICRFMHLGSLAVISYNQLFYIIPASNKRGL